MRQCVMTAIMQDLALEHVNTGYLPQFDLSVNQEPSPRETASRSSSQC